MRYYQKYLKYKLKYLELKRMIGAKPKNKILLTGEPGVGKSTLLKKIISGFNNKKTGLITNEQLNANGERTGFESVTSTGLQSQIAVKTNAPADVGKYKVNVTNFDKQISTISNFDNDALLYIDEIAPMQTFSENFKLLVDKYLDSNNFVIGTIKKDTTDPFVNAVKQRNDVEVIEITKDNRDAMEQYINEMINNYFVT